MGKFILKSVLKINEMQVDKSELPESDFSLQNGDTFYQFKHVSEPQEDKYIVKPGIVTVSVKNERLVLAPSGFTEENILEEYVVTKDITEKIDRFFSKIDTYKKYGVFPKRGILLYGAPGCGKSMSLSKIAKQYSSTGDTVVIIWRTDKFEARTIKDFITMFKYDPSVKRMILIAEDIGGIEYVGQKMKIDSSLLSLLDNVEQTFTIPTMIVATTNYPENLLENLTNRPQRFDDVIEIKTPSGEFRQKFLEFFSQGEATEDAKTKIADKRYEGFSVAHIKEIVIRAALYDIGLSESIDQLYAHAEKAKNDFIKRQKVGL